MKHQNANPFYDYRGCYKYTPYVYKVNGGNRWGDPDDPELEYDDELQLEEKDRCKEEE